MRPKLVSKDREELKLRYNTRGGMCMKCPKCGSEHVQFATNTSGGGISFLDSREVNRNGYK